MQDDGSQRPSSAGDHPRPWQRLAARGSVIPAGAWRSPLRGPRLTSVLGLALLVTLPVVTITGLLSYIAYGPGLGQARPGDVGLLHLPVFDWPTRPSWLYRLNQGVHVGLGLALVPVVLAKLWSVVPRLFIFPPARSVAQALERVTLLMLVGGILFEIVTGVLNIQYDYVFGFSFYDAHYYGAWVFIAGFVSHVCLKLPAMVRALRSRSTPADEAGLVAEEPAPPTISRRGALALVGGGSALMFLLTAGQTIGGPTRGLALLLPRGRDTGDGPNDFPVNRTAEAAGTTSAATDPAWRLSLTGGPEDVALGRDELLAMTQHTASLPIACVEGWSTTQRWTGVRLRDLAALAGVDAPSVAVVSSLEESGSFNQAALNGNQVLDPDSLLALSVNGVDLSVDHGFPARVIVPALPGVLNTKWVRAISFEAD